MENTARVTAICIEAFARIAASISHEIKNTLSIINENAGLLEDLALMSGEDGGVSSERIRTATASIARQVARSNIIMKDLNRFAHSGDLPINRVSIEETLSLVINLASRQAAMRKLQVNASCPPELSCQTRPFILNVLLYTSLRRIYTAVDESSKLLIEAATTPSGVVITVHPQDSTNEGFMPPGNDDEQILIEYLAGTGRAGDKLLTLTIPHDIGHGSAEMSG